MSKNINSKHTFYNVELPKSWEIRTVDSIKAKEKYSCAAGPFGSSISAKFFVDQGIPVIRGCNLSLGKESFIAKDFVFITEDKAKSFLGQQVKAGDLVFTCWGTLGQVGLIPANGQYEKYVISNKQLKLRPNFDICNSKYLYYYFSLPQMVQYINNIAIGSAVPGINLGLLKKIKVVLPPIEIQNKITAILSAYDDLIENNKRRIALLEKMAEEIYREWFVRFRFPGYQQAKFEKGIPVGWSVKPISKLCNEVRHGIKKENLKDDELYLGLEHFSRKSISIKQFDTAESINSNKLKFQRRDILFAKIRPYLHKIAIAHFSGACSIDTIVIRPTDKMYEAFLLFTIFSDTFIELATISSKGTKMPRADWDFLSRLELIIPNKNILDKYQQIFDVIFDEIVNLLESNELLTQTKNKLLPRLISGKLSIENLDIEFPPSML